MRAGSDACPNQRMESVFSIFGKKKPEKGPQKAQASKTQKRSSFRMPVEFEVFYTLASRSGRRHGRANDLSAGGLRLSSDEDMLKHSKLELDFRLPDDFLEDLTVEKEVFEQTPFGLRPGTVKEQPPKFEPMTVSAVVLSTFYDVTSKKLAHGIKFENQSEHIKEELQRFVHLWQLHQIRLRAELNK